MLKNDVADVVNRCRERIENPNALVVNTGEKRVCEYKLL